MIILNRKQFRNYWNNLCPGLGDEGSGLWALEHHTGKKSRWFISTRNIFTQTEEEKQKIPDIKQYFHRWCYNNTLGQILCYSSNYNEDWWGFSHKDDIFLFRLRWS